MKKVLLIVTAAVIMLGVSNMTFAADKTKNDPNKVKLEKEKKKVKAEKKAKKEAATEKASVGKGKDHKQQVNALEKKAHVAEKTTAKESKIENKVADANQTAPTTVPPSPNK